MIERISKKYAMTEKGAKDYVAAVFWSVLVNISKMLPVGVLATALSGIVEALTNGADPRAGLTRFLVAGVLALAALFVTFLIQYKALYEATYRESANRRIRLAEVLRQLPLSLRILKLPKQITNVIKCKNPRCITSIEQGLDHVFILADPEKEVYRCKYCEEKYRGKRNK